MAARYQDPASIPLNSRTTCVATSPECPARWASQGEYSPRQTFAWPAFGACCILKPTAKPPPWLFIYLIVYLPSFRLLFILFVYAYYTHTYATISRHTTNTTHNYSRSLADGQSQHSFSNNSHRGYLGSAFPSNLVNSRPELRQSRQSLAAASERMSRASYAGSIHGGGNGGGGGGGGGGGLPVTSLMAMSGMVGGGGPASIASSARRSRPRSRSREQLNASHIHNHRPGSR